MCSRIDCSDIDPAPDQVVEHRAHLARGFGIRQLFEQHLAGLVEFIQHLALRRIPDRALRPGHGHIAGAPGDWRDEVAAMGRVDDCRTCRQLDLALAVRIANRQLTTVILVRIG